MALGYDMVEKVRFSVIGGILFVLALLVSAPASALAQAAIPDEFTNLQFLPEDIEQRALITIMRGFTRSLGVGRCTFCHTVSPRLDQPDDDFASDDKPTKRKARAMLRMVAAINGDHISQLPDRGEPNIEVSCSTCHNGKNRPTTLAQELGWAYEEDGVDAVTARYTELRERYFGRGAFDFGARTLEDFASGLPDSDLDGSLTVIELNLEHYPESAQSWLIKGVVHQQQGENDLAIEAFERSLELGPGNPFVTRSLEQLRGGGGGGG